MRNYIQFWFGITDYEDGGHNPLAPIYSLEGTPDEVQLELNDLKDSLIQNGFFVTSQSILGTRYFQLDKATVGQLLGGFNTATLWQFPIESQQSSITPRHDPNWSSNDGPQRKTTTST